MAICFSPKKIREVFFVHMEALDCLYHNKKAHGLRERFTFFCDIDWKLSRFPRTKKSKYASNLCIYYYSISLFLFCFSCSLY